MTTNAERQQTSGYGPLDDLRHRPEPGKRMRDSLFYEMVMPDELGIQIYLYLTGTGRTGDNVSVWGPGPEPVALVLGGGRVPDDRDFDHFEFDGLTIEQPELLQSAKVHPWRWPRRPIVAASVSP